MRKLAIMYDELHIITKIMFFRLPFVVLLLYFMAGSYYSYYTLYFRAKRQMVEDLGVILLSMINHFVV